MNFFKLISFSIILLSSTLSEACSHRSYDYKLPDEIGNDFKIFHEKTTHFVWDGNVPLHEWTSSVEKTISIVNDKGEKEITIPENLTTWIFEDGTFIPMAKIQGGNSYSIITDHLGTPTEAYNDQGRKVWSRGLNIYGETRKETGLKNFIPYLYQGQYLDVETELAYNRFRYYSPESGTYISQDPIGLDGKILNLYSYASDVNSLIDPYGLACQAGRSVDDICKKHGGKKTGNNRFEFEGPGAKKRAKQAASEISGDLGSDPKAIRRKDYTDPNNTYRDNNSNRVIGKHSSNVDSNGKPISGFHDHEIGHSRFDAPPHYNAWSESTGTHYTDNVHLFY